MGNRLDLSKMLHEILGSDNVYFQPPPSKKMHFPCIVYERVRLNTDFADNKPYKIDKVYQITYIDSDPDSDMPMKIANLPQCVFERQFISDNLYHNVFRLTY